VNLESQFDFVAVLARCGGGCVFPHDRLRVWGGLFLEIAIMVAATSSFESRSLKDLHDARLARDPNS
jgi:hypothetical protein